MIVRIVYNIVLLVGLIVFAPVLFVKVILTPKYRGRILGRLGIGLKRFVPDFIQGHPRIWVHALSVGEVSSAKTLVRAVRENFPEASIFFSSATRSGEIYAREVLEDVIDFFVPFPLDAPICVKTVLNGVRPDIFVLVETDFWPNFLWELEARDIPAVLVNGRISDKSFERYRKLQWFFLPLFAMFRVIAMQTGSDASNMMRLGVPQKKVTVLGNLKYDAVIPETKNRGPGSGREKFSIPPDAVVWVAGSTHAGEEDIILSVFRTLQTRFLNLFLVIAPRNIERAKEVQTLAEGIVGAGKIFLRSNPAPPERRVMILDSLGELAGLYSACDLAFVGGSLVQEGGHNPLEPAVYAKPVIFGPYMDDFREISSDLLLAGGALMAHSEEELHELMEDLLMDEELRQIMGNKGKNLVTEQRGATLRHLAMIRKVLGKEETV